MNKPMEEYVWHDGVRIREDQIVSMAKNAGSLVLAEHYMCSLLVHGVCCGRSNYLNKVNEVRAFYGAATIPVPQYEDSVQLPGQEPTKMMARRRYAAMNVEQRKQVLRQSLDILIGQHRLLFTSKTCWIGIYLVVIGRLDETVSKTDFTEMAPDITPDGWPEELAIGDRTLSNFARYVDAKDRLEAYYDMENNPWEALCDTFWEILEQQILTQG